MLSAEQVRKAEEDARRDSLTLSRVLVRDGLVLSRDLSAFVALHLGLTLVDLPSEKLDPDVVSLLPEDVANRYIALPLRRHESSLTVAMADPTDLQAIQDLTARTGLRIETEVASDQEIEQHIEIAYKLARTKERGRGIGGRGRRQQADGRPA